MSAADAHRITLGRISGVYGIKGWVKVFSYSRPLENILEYPLWILGTPGFETRLLDGRAQAGGVVAHLTDARGRAITDRDEAAKLIGLDIAVPRSALPKARPGEIYWMDLIGMAVQTIEGAALGVVAEVTSNGAQDVLVVSDAAVKDADGKAVERLIPFVRGPVIETVDQDKRLITAHWQPEW